MQIKPRITKILTPALWHQQWLCAGGHCGGLGASPADAYHRWASNYAIEQHRQQLRRYNPLAQEILDSQRENYFPEKK